MRAADGRPVEPLALGLGDAACRWRARRGSRCFRRANPRCAGFGLQPGPPAHPATLVRGADARVAVAADGTSPGHGRCRVTQPRPVVSVDDDAYVLPAHSLKGRPTAVPASATWSGNCATSCPVPPGHPHRLHPAARPDHGAHRRSTGTRGYTERSPAPATPPASPDRSRSPPWFRSSICSKRCCGRCALPAHHDCVRSPECPSTRLWPVSSRWRAPRSTWRSCGIWPRIAAF